MCTCEYTCVGVGVVYTRVRGHVCMCEYTCGCVRMCVCVCNLCLQVFCRWSRGAGEDNLLSSSGQTPVILNILLKTFYKYIGSPIYFLLHLTCRTSTQE